MDKKKLPVKKKVVQPKVEARKVTAVKAEALEAVSPIGGSGATSGKLRSQAEKIARKEDPDVPEELRALSPEATKKLLHDLRVHQIELEMQNEELRTAQAKLEKSRAQYFELFDHAPVGYFNISEQGLILEANLAAADLLGVVPGYLQAKPFISFIFKEDQDVYYLHRKQLFATRAPQASEMRMVRRDGPLFWTRMESNVVQDGESGKPVCRVTINDITEHKKMEQALNEEHWRLQSIIEGTNAGTWEWNVQTGETVFNETWAQITGYTLDELSPISIKTWEALVHPQDLKQSDELLERHFSGELPYYDCECRMKHKDGHWVWVHDRGRVVTSNAEGKPMLMFGSHSDVTDRKRMEEERERIEKLEAVGRLAGGIAHDFNNILTAILGNISLARMEAAPGSEISVSLEQAEQASLRAKDLTVQLLTFSKGGAPVKKLGSLTELLSDTADFVLRGSNVKCRYSFPADLWHAEIDAGQVSQVIRNLVVNAQQSMPAGGTMDISAENLALTEKQSSGRGLPLRPGNYVMISVTDHGSGIPVDHLKKIFEPFFTTRPKSSGMGLATSFSIVRQHGGHLNVESKAGSGSTFHIYLPTSVESAAAKQDKIDAASRTGKARILVMDDEKTVREIAGRMLKHIGYADIEFATDGIEAIKLYKAAIELGNPFSMAILDLTIPGGMGGEMTIRNLLKIDPAVKAIVSSGYVDDPVMARYSEYGFSGVVAKPYTIAELRKAMQDVMG